MKIQICTLARSPIPFDRYMIKMLCEEWSRQGHECRVGFCSDLEADVGILHIDRTRVEARHIPGNPLGRAFLNADVLDISKRKVSGCLLSKGSLHDGPVIIKTDANAFGGPERSELSRFSLAHLLLRIKIKLKWRFADDMAFGRYPILQSIHEVPAWVWNDERLVVEKFLPEQEGSLYALRLWAFFGSYDYNVRLLSRSPIVKAANLSGYDYLDRVPDVLRAFRKAWKLDFGKIDYVVSDGKVVILDVNKTPTVASSAAKSSGRISRLAQGLSDYL